MTRVSVGVILGVVFALIGASIALDLIFDLAIPLLRVALAVGLLLLGARLIAHAWSRAPEPPSGEAWMADRRFAPAALARDERFDVVFGRGVVDLTHVGAPDHDVTVTVDTLFGASRIEIDPAIAYDVDGSSTFGEVRMPDRSATAMGTLRYEHAAATAAPARLHLRVHTIFGQCQVVEAPPAAA